MTREEFEAVLDLENLYALQTGFIRGHRGKGRYVASLRVRGIHVKHHYMFAYAHSEDRAIQRLIDIYANH